MDDIVEWGLDDIDAFVSTNSEHEISEMVYA